MQKAAKFWFFCANECVCLRVQIPCSAIEKKGNGYRLVYLVEVALTDVNNLSIISQ